MESLGEEHYKQDTNDDDQGGHGIHEPQKDEQEDPDKVAIFEWVNILSLH